ncbi:hypothetical protein G6F56_009846 [Rhizopus delemar]|nr:hypothetical protein G6F56_009846 [Rhizopus delemar]
MADDSETKSKKIIQQAEVDALLRSVQTLEVKRKELFLENSIRDLKRKWIKKDESSQLTLEQNANNTNVYTQIQSVKVHRGQIDQQIQNEKSKLARARQILFDSVNEKLERAEGGVESENKLVISQQNWKGITKAENCTIDPILLNSGKATFSGINDGLILMTDTVNLSMDKFKFHLQLYNRFAVLNEDTHPPLDLDTEDSESLKIQRSLRVYSRDVDYGSGARSYNENLEREKRKDSSGLKILNIESTMAKNSIYGLASAQQVDDWKTNMESNFIELRKFYYSSKRMKKRTKELKKKYVDRLCSEERYFVSPVKDRKRVMFVEDRGLAMGSRLKGFMRYGGLWKPKQHSRYAAVYVTNEQNTSQTCVFCFKKLMHPLKNEL